MNKPNIKHIPLSLLCVYLVRSLILNAVTFNDALVFAILAGLTAFYELQLESDKIKLIYKQMELLKENDQRQELIISDARNSLSTIKVSGAVSGIRR